MRIKGLESRLLKSFRRLSSQRARSLVEYADFLAQQEPPPETQEKRELPRPQTETVIAAIKRLGATYPMLDRAVLLNETSSLMTQHLMRGRKALEIIDELETVFGQEYQKFLNAADDET